MSVYRVLSRRSEVDSELLHGILESWKANVDRGLASRFLLVKGGVQISSRGANGMTGRGLAGDTLTLALVWSGKSLMSEGSEEKKEVEGFLEIGL
jgi:hypothetical protein